MVLTSTLNEIRVDNMGEPKMLRLVFATIVAADLAAIMIYPAEKPTFEQRWIPAQSAWSPYKGYRLPVGPPAGFYKPPVPISAKPRSNWLANPHIGTRIACTSFCEFP